MRKYKANTIEDREKKKNIKKEKKQPTKLISVSPTWAQDMGHIRPKSPYFFHILGAF
jgi:hypothetical protein